MDDRKDEVSIARRKKEYGVRKGDFHYNGYPLSNEDLKVFNEFLQKVVKEQKESTKER